MAKGDNGVPTTAVREGPSGQRIDGLNSSFVGATASRGKWWKRQVFALRGTPLSQWPGSTLLVQSPRLSKTVTHVHQRLDRKITTGTPRTPALPNGLLVTYKSFCGICDSAVQGHRRKDNHLREYALGSFKDNGTIYPGY